MPVHTRKKMEDWGKQAGSAKVRVLGTGVRFARRAQRQATTQNVKPRWSLMRAQSTILGQKFASLAYGNC